jgi:hypothetical protein
MQDFMRSDPWMDRARYPNQGMLKFDLFAPMIGSGASVRG